MGTDDDVRGIAPFGGRNDDPRRQRLLNRLRRGPNVPQGDGLAARPMPQVPERPDGPGHARLYQAAAAKAQPLLDAADRALAINPLPREIAAARGPYVNASTTLAAELQLPDYVKAQRSLALKVQAAQTVLAEKVKADAARQKKEQHDGQAAAYAEMAPVLADVKRINVPQGMAAHIGKEHKKAGPEFQTYLARLQALEDAKAPVTKPADRVAPALAGTLIDRCQAVADAAQAYLLHHEGLNDAPKNSAEGIARKRHCEEGLKAASQYALAMEIDRAGPPTQNAPWDRKTQMRVAGAQARFKFEQGNKKLQGLADDGGGKGASESYWLKSKSIAEVGAELSGGTAAKGSREYIFKPTVGEDFPDGMNEQKGSGAAKEALASSNAKLFAAQTGIDLGVPETTVVSMGQYAVSGGDLAGPALVGSVQQLAAGTSTEVRGLPRDTFRKIKPREVQKIALLDLMSLSMDRHGGNVMVDTSDPDNPKLVPIDHGGTLPSRKDFPGAKGRMGGVTGSQWNESTSPVNTLLQIPSAFEPFDPDIVAGLDLLQPAAIEADMKAQLAAMDDIHPGLDASTKVGADNLHMSKRSMMFVKKAAKVLSPAEVQIALAQHGETLFDAQPDTQFETLADRVIADAAPKKAAYQELLGISGNERFLIAAFLVNSKWARTNVEACEMMMAEPKAALDLFKNGQVNNAAPPDDMFKLPFGTARTYTQVDLDDVLAVFPGAKSLKVDPSSQGNFRGYYAAYEEFVANGWTANSLAQAAQAIGGTAPANPKDGLQVMKAWRALQTPAYQAELAKLPLDGTQKCVDNVGTLMKAKNSANIKSQMAATAAASAGQLDPTTTASTHATTLAAQAKASLDLFSDAQRAAPLLPQWQQLGQKIAQGAGANRTPQDFAKEVEADARRLYDAVYAAALEDVRLAYPAVVADMRGLRPPDKGTIPDADDLKVTTYFQNIKDIELSFSGAGNLFIARDTLAKFIADKQAVRAFAVPVAPTAQPGPTAAQRPARPVVPNPAAINALPDFDWDQDTASAAKKQAVKLKLFKDKDTGMTDALKPVNKARAAADNINAALPKDKKIALYAAAERACDEFSRFVNGKLRGLSRDPAWAAYCDSAAKAAEGQFNKFKALRLVLG